MSNTINTGGPAFPCEWDYIDTNRQMANGMTMRDYTAIKVLAGFAANPAIFATNGRTGWGLVNCTEGQLCQAALSIADAMLKERDA